jgi:hypothetical protein
MMQEPYTELIDRANPSFFVLLVDQSGSMSRPFGGRKQTKAQGVADAINRLIHAIVLSCSVGNEVRDRFYVGMIGYSSDIHMHFGGALDGQFHVPLSALADNPLRIETRIKKIDDGAGGILEQKTRFPVWLDPVANGKTRMREALETARDWVKEFVDSYPSSFPPLVVNITDGLPTDATPDHFPEVEKASQEIRAIANQNGSRALLFNIHLSEEVREPIAYPQAENQLPDKYSRLLFRMSSELTPEMRRIANANESDLEIPPGARGFVFQGDLVSVIQLLDIGTKIGANS